MELVGKTVKSKINGKVFHIDETYTDNGHKYYKVREISTGKILPVHGRLLDEMCMTYLEIVKENEQ